DWRERLSQLEPLDPEVAMATATYGEVIAGAKDPATLTLAKTAALGQKRGALTHALGELPKLPLERRKTRGRALNEAKRLLEELEAAKRRALEREAEGRSALDVTIPGRRPWVGRRHVLGQICDELLDLFHGLGYSVYR